MDDCSEDGAVANPLCTLGCCCGLGGDDDELLFPCPDPVFINFFPISEKDVCFFVVAIFDNTLENTDDAIDGNAAVSGVVPVVVVVDDAAVDDDNLLGDDLCGELLFIGIAVPTTTLPLIFIVVVVSESYLLI